MKKIALFVVAKLYPLATFQQKAVTNECKRKIEFEFMKYIRALTEESPFPFENILFHSQCQRNISHQPLV